MYLRDDQISIVECRSVQLDEDLTFAHFWDLSLAKVETIESNVVAGKDPLLARGWSHVCGCVVVRLLRNVEAVW